MTIINIFVIICLFGGLVALFRELERAYKFNKFLQKAEERFEKSIQEYYAEQRRKTEQAKSEIKNTVKKEKRSTIKPIGYGTVEITLPNTKKSLNKTAKKVVKKSK
mgnify:FL=1